MKGISIYMLLVAITCVFSAGAQTLGGNSAYSFLKLPASPQLSALGGVNVSQINPDIFLSFNNPSLLRENMHGHLAASFNSFYGGTKNYGFLAGFREQKSATNFSMGVHFLDYGSIPQTDVSGMETGVFRPRDYLVQVAASRRYLEKWHYGITMKWVGSSYGIYRSSGFAADFGISYMDSARNLQVSLVAANTGVQLRSFGAEKEELPFDVQAGISHRLKEAPMQFSLNIHHLHRFDIRYSDPFFNEATDAAPSDNGFLNGFLRHLILSAQVFPADMVEITAGYNFLRRSELNVPGTANGLNGISLGMGVVLKQFSFRYASTWYQNNRAYHQIALNVPLGERQNW